MGTCTGNIVRCRCHYLFFCLAWVYTIRVAIAKVIKGHGLSKKRLKLFLCVQLFFVLAVLALTRIALPNALKLFIDKQSSSEFCIPTTSCPWRNACAFPTLIRNNNVIFLHA